MKAQRIVSLTLFVLVAASSQFAKANTILGAAVGAAVGSAVGQNANGRNGAVIGAAIGGAFGAGIGHEMEESHSPVYVEHEQPNYRVEHDRVVHVYDEPCEEPVYVVHRRHYDPRYYRFLPPRRGYAYDRWHRY